MKIEITPEELQLVLYSLEYREHYYAYSGAEVLPELNAVNSLLYNRLSEIQERVIPEREAEYRYPFYDIVPKDGQHCLFKDGVEIARFDDLAKAEEAHEFHMHEVVRQLEESARSIEFEKSSTEREAQDQGRSLELDRGMEM